MLSLRVVAHIQHYSNDHLHCSHHQIAHWHREGGEVVDLFPSALSYRNDLVGGQHVEAATQKSSTDSAQHKVQSYSCMKAVEESEGNDDPYAGIDEEVVFDIFCEGRRGLVDILV